MAGIYRDNGKENGNSDNGFYRGYIGVKVGDCRIRFFWLNRCLAVSVVLHCETHHVPPARSCLPARSSFWRHACGSVSVSGDHVDTTI